MSRLTARRLALLAALAGTMLGGGAAAQDVPVRPSGASSLEEGFATPPSSARPRVWWHWLNGNITIDGIDKDLDWLASIGIGGVQNFDANLTTPQIVDKRMVYMQPDWKAAFRHAVERASARGLEFAIASSPGWSETGGPWVPPADGMKKLTWSEAVIPGGKPFKGQIAAPPGVTGLYQTLPVEELFADPSQPERKVPQAAGDIAVLAVPAAAGATPMPRSAKLADGSAIAPAALADADPQGAVDMPAGTTQNPATLTLDYGKPVRMASVRLFIKNARPPFAPPRYAARLQAQLNGEWRDLTEIPLSDAATTVTFPPVSASQFRIVVAPGAPFPAGGLGSVPGAVIMDLFPAPSINSIAVGQFQLFPEQRVEQAESKAGFGTVPNYYAIDTKQAANGPRPDQVVDLTDRLRPDGTLDWTPPKGTDWRVLRFGWSLTGKTNHPATPEATGLEVDKYDAAAVERYLNAYLAMYRDAVGAGNMGSNGIRALLTDSIEVGASNWTPRLIEAFKARRGYDPLPWLPTLAGTVIGSSAQSDRFLYDYRRTLGDLIAEAHYGTVAKVAHANGLTVYGEALEDDRPVLGDDLDMRSHADVPMGALWTFPKGGSPRTGLLGDIKGAASVSHFYGQNLVAAESMTSAFSPWAFAPADLKPVIDLEFAQGVNRPVIHTSVHQPTDDKLPGLSLSIFGQYFNRHESWAGMAKPWVDYIARTSYLLQQGHDAADIAIFYGEETPVTTLYSRGVPAWLPKSHAFDFVNAKMLAALKVEGDGVMVSPGGARYRALQLAGTSDRMTLPVLREIRRLAEGGGRIIGRQPDAAPGLQDSADEFARLVRDIWSRPNVLPETDVEAAAAKLGLGPDFTAVGGATDADLRFVHRRTEEGDLYFIVNRESRAVKTQIRFGVAGRAPELWRAIDGTMQPLGYQSDGRSTTVPVDLGAEDAVFVMFRKPAAGATAAQLASPVWRDVATISTPWEVAFEAQRGAPASITMPTLEPLDKNAVPGVRYFSGTATYGTTVTRPKGLHKGEKLWLDLGKVGDVAEVLVNGKSAGTLWFAPYRVEVGSLLKGGSNRLEVKVANLWVNRLIGDQQPGTTPIGWTAVPTYRPDAPLRPSGLIGPVKLMAGQ